MHALYENGFGSDFVDTVYTAVFGGDTESTKIVQADIVTIFQPIYDIVFHQHPLTCQFLTEGRRTVRYFFKHPLFVYCATADYFGIKTRYFLAVLIQVIINGDKSVLYTHTILFL